MRLAASGISNEPGTHSTSIASGSTSCRTSASSAPSMSFEVTNSLKRATTIPMRSPRPVNMPSIVRIVSLLKPAAYRGALVPPCGCVGVAPPLAPVRRTLAGGGPRGAVVCHAGRVADCLCPANGGEVGDADDRDVVARGEALQFGEAGHGPVVRHDLADRHHRVEPGQARQVDRRLGLFRSLQHPAGTGAEREDVA